MFLAAGIQQLNVAPSPDNTSGKYWPAHKILAHIAGPHRDKTCLRVSDETSFIPVSSATETS